MSCASSLQSLGRYSPPSWQTIALNLVTSLCPWIQLAMNPGKERSVTYQGEQGDDVPPYEAPNIAVRSPSISGNASLTNSSPATRSMKGFPPHWFLISSQNFCPYPVDPVGLRTASALAPATKRNRPT